MEMREFRKQIEEKLVHDDWTIQYDHKESTLRVEDKQLKKGVTLALKPLLAKWERGEFDSIDEVVRYVEIGLHSMKQQVQLRGNEKKILPVIRSTSFPTETKEGIKLIYHEHTAETRIYYALDLGESYTLINEEAINEAALSPEKIKEMALFNIRSLEQPINEDQVAGNTFYFLRAKDGYDASRILDQSLLDKMEQKVKGKLALAVPHQDVLIFADILNDTGYDVLAQIALQFFKDGRIPITALPFLYENGELEPTFILAQKKPKDPSSTKK
ncbi:hypothetical protein AJ85_07340 [Alkalihalobacillus alcalophilus ATCC 27647 = CGMCC 1.3604]|uniref:UPF0354 protein AJ85_07340 n=1 Tax=Alkalihalobacillus alcalophilus ATCC 27647 = CGMCC 1.3604 TaxID=1218173 RepID=A0A4S4K0G0_ALKAL|nr:DUF1444 domain-containing protein [Alkalihalobacillus alcalophilus]MED1564230.1 DUF1444 domain-containing protein [Alkalihalobacillus alcalophilus]THG91066.1 hypothetical protein AJ85_07340 [Alkalihalobacillus alcalophilus ATCC 27647 = CGMCC 1.3604]